MKKVYETRLNLSGVAVLDSEGQPILDAEGNVKTETKKKVIESSSTYKNICEAQAKAGLQPPVVDKTQTFEYTEFESTSEVLDYFISLGLDPTVAEKSALSMFQRGWAIAQQQEVYTFMSDDEQAEVEGAYSVALGAAQPGERKQKDPMTLIAKGLKAAGLDISASDLAAFIASMQSNQTPA